VIRETVELFGPERCMFGSNFPIEKLWTTYEEVVRVTTECLAGLSAGEQRAVLHDTADRVYRLGS
jgi:predicted TIM-barrel fold metal-dependent hydrolase